MFEGDWSALAAPKMHWFCALRAIVCLTSVSLLTSAKDVAASPFDEPLQPKLFGDAQLRYQNTRLESVTEDINRLTARLRLGLEARLSDRLSVLVEGEGVLALVDRFDPPSNFPPLPNIDDPNVVELNRAQLLVTLSEQSFVTVGRHRLEIDDQRFLGRAGFRLNEQTFDGVHGFVRTRPGVTVQAGYFGRVNRPLGAKSPVGKFSGDSYYANANLPTPIGRIGVFHYALDLETGSDDNLTNQFSSRTTGIRYDGRWHADDLGLDVEASYARQTDFADNPSDFSADYWLIGAQAFLGSFRIGGRVESLGDGGDGGGSFKTPAGALHRFQGDADVFVITPDQGLLDREVSAVWALNRVGPLGGVSFSLSHHWFEATAFDQTYGAEVDFRLTAAFRGVKTALTFADYNADTFAEDTRRVFLSFSRRF